MFEPSSLLQVTLGSLSYFYYFNVREKNRLFARLAKVLFYSQRVAQIRQKTARSPLS